MRKACSVILFMVAILMTLAFAKLPFAEAIGFMRDKVDLPMKAWKDIQSGMHARAFVIAGAMKGEMLSEFHKSITDHIANGGTLNDFRKDFDKIVARHGWSYKGSRGWRTQVIYNTNMRTAYAAGKYKQMTRPGALKVKPYWRYVGGLSGDPRPEHLDWSGTILPADHPWWQTHTPPNGWGCKCKIVGVSKREIERRGLKVADRSPTPRNSRAGIDKSFFYNPGVAGFGEPHAFTVMRDYQKFKKRFAPMTPGNPQMFGRPRLVRRDPQKGSVDRAIPETRQGMEDALRSILGGEEKVFSYQRGEFRYDFTVNAASLAEHLEPNADRAKFLPLLGDLLENPFEIWQSFEKDMKTGKVVLRHRFVKAFDVKGGSNLLFVAQAKGGRLEDLTMIPISKDKELNKSRRGKLVYGG